MTAITADQEHNRDSSQRDLTTQKEGLYVLCIHGTWSSGKWADRSSPFVCELKEQLQNLGYTKLWADSVRWDAKNRWKARQHVAEQVAKHLDDVQNTFGHGWEFLIVAHSHGGNAAVEALRDVINAQTEPYIRGIVCLNTPFLTQEVRGSSAHVLLWFLVAAGLTAAVSQVQPDTSAVVSILGFSQTPLMATAIFPGLVFLSFILFLLYLLGKIVRFRDCKRLKEFQWGPKTNVLCLSCPDDEAITLLGFLEGVSNLPQLFLHPFALLIVTFLTFCFVWMGGYHWQQQIIVAASAFGTWVAIALLCGFLGTCLVTIAFGLSILQALKALVARILVSYTPLRPVQCFFQPITKLKVFTSPLRLFHSQIFDSPQTIPTISKWLAQMRAQEAKSAYKMWMRTERM